MKRKLNLVLTTKWYDMIESGEKTEEYRLIKQFYIKRFCRDRLSTSKCDYNGVPNDCYSADGEHLCEDCVNCDYGTINDWWKCTNEDITEPIYDEVCFHRGYTKTNMSFIIKDISIGKGKTEWGAPQEEGVLIIKLGEKI